MANAKAIEAIIRQRGSNLMTKEEKKVIIRKRITNKPWEGLTPGTREWKKVWKEYPKYQHDMIKYQLEKGDDTMTEIEADRRKREIEKKTIERYVDKHGVQTKRGRGEDEDEDEEEERPPKRNHRATIIKKEVSMPKKRVVEEEEDDVTTDEIRGMKRKELYKFIEVNKLVFDEDEFDDLDEFKEAVIEYLIENEYLEEEKEEEEEEESTPKKIVRSHKKEVMRTNPFDGPRTFDQYALPIPEHIKSLKQLTIWMKGEDKKDLLTLIEFKDNELRVYAPERVTSSDRVAVAVPKKTATNVIPSYRSNKNSKQVGVNVNAKDVRDVAWLRRRINRTS